MTTMTRLLLSRRRRMTRSPPQDRERLLRAVPRPPPTCHAPRPGGGGVLGGRTWARCHFSPRDESTGVPPNEGREKLLPPLIKPRRQLLLRLPLPHSQPSLSFRSRLRATHYLPPSSSPPTHTASEQSRVHFPWSSSPSSRCLPSDRPRPQKGEEQRSQGPSPPLLRCC